MIVRSKRDSSLKSVPTFFTCWDIAVECHIVRIWPTYSTSSFFRRCGRNVCLFFLLYNAWGMDPKSTTEREEWKQELFSSLLIEPNPCVCANLWVTVKTWFCQCWYWSCTSFSPSISFVYRISLFLPDSEVLNEQEMVRNVSKESENRLNGECRRILP